MLAQEGARVATRVDPTAETLQLRWLTMTSRRNRACRHYVRQQFERTNEFTVPRFSVVVKSGAPCSRKRVQSVQLDKKYPEAITHNLWGSALPLRDLDTAGLTPCPANRDVRAFSYPSASAPAAGPTWSMVRTQL